MRKMRTLLDRLLEVLAGGSLLLMVALTTWQVITRYLLHDPSTWSEELVSYMFAFASLFGAAIVSGERNHMNIPIAVEHMNHKLQVLFGVMGEVVAAAFAVMILIFGGIRISTLAMGQMTSSLGVPIGIFYVVMPVTGVVILLYSILNIIEILKGDINALPPYERTSEEE